MPGMIPAVYKFTKKQRGRDSMSSTERGLTERILGRIHGDNRGMQTQVKTGHGFVDQLINASRPAPAAPRLVVVTKIACYPVPNSLEACMHHNKCCDL